MLTLAMPQSEPSAARNRSASCWSRVKIDDDRPWGRRCATRSPRRTCHRSVRRGSGRRSPRGRRALRGHPDDRGLDVDARRPGPAALAADDDLAAFGLGPFQRAACAAPARGRDQRPDEGRRRRTGRRWAAGRRPRRAARADRRRRRGARSGGAAWCSAGRRCRQRRTRCRAAPGRGRPTAVDDGGVVAAQLEQSAAEPCGDPRADLAAHPGRAGGADQRDSRVVDQLPRRWRGRRGRAGARRAERRPGVIARSSRCAVATEISGVSSTGFQTTVSPHTSAIAVFHDHTAAGKLNAEITPTTPSGCQVSASRWPGRSEAIVFP